jgi:hypothetical protein
VIEDIERKIMRLRRLQEKSLTVESPGEYPTKSRTPVADVCRYQNDGTYQNGTEKITPSRFIERAAEESEDWSVELGDAVYRYIDNGDDSSLLAAADDMARDISRVCDRVKTGRLKRSFIGRVSEG